MSTGTPHWRLGIDVRSGIEESLPAGSDRMHAFGASDYIDPPI